jgi:hypothetical protein
VIGGRECSLFWIHFSNIQGLTLDGSGVINGNGEDWWSRVMYINIYTYIVLTIQIEYILYVPNYQVKKVQFQIKFDI